jgi:hypothetical protein
MAFAAALAESGIAPPGIGECVRHEVITMTLPLPCAFRWGIAALQHGEWLNDEYLERIAQVLERGFL